jgi:anti-sigma B factor antagonist
MADARFTPDDLASVSIEDLGAVVVVRMSGEIDGSTADLVGEPLFSCLETAPSAVVVDLTNLQFMGSTGLNILVRAHETALSRAIALRIVASTRAVLHTVEISGLDTYLPMSRSVPEALTSIGIPADR